MLKFFRRAKELVRLGVEMVSTPERTKSVRLHQSDFGKSKIVNKLQTVAYLFTFTFESAQWSMKKTLRYDT